MPRPVVFTSIDEFRAALADPAMKRFVREFFKLRCDSAYGVVKTSVAANTFRAFPFRTLNLNLPPSTLYREWTTNWLEGAVTKLRSIHSHEEMRRFVIAAANQLDKHWSRRTEGKHRIGFGRAAKLLNLTVKHAMWLNTITRKERETLIPLLDVPLDSFTLRGVRLLLPALKIPPNASMSFVTDRVHYEVIQKAIQSLCEPKFHPIEYEFVAWNLAHPDINPAEQVEAIRQSPRRLAQ